MIMKVPSLRRSQYTQRSQQILTSVGPRPAKKSLPVRADESASSRETGRNNEHSAPASPIQRRGAQAKSFYEEL